ncbi:MAG: DUF2975 domain-containing protein [Bacteroidetes bacterium]|nr:DUF2975 domain-containing protein [Bacteroidota bacterium]
MTTASQWVFKALHVLSWVIFIGLCIKTGAILTSFSISLWVNPVAASDLYEGLNLKPIADYHLWLYICVVSFLVTIHALQAMIAFLLTRVFNVLDLNRPFSETLTLLFSRISYYAFGTGIVAILANQFHDSLNKKGLTVPLSWNAFEMLFFAGIIYLLAIIYQRGTDLQSETDATV